MIGGPWIAPYRFIHTQKLQTHYGDKNVLHAHTFIAKEGYLTEKRCLINVPFIINFLKAFVTNLMISNTKWSCIDHNHEKVTMSPPQYLACFVETLGHILDKIRRECCVVVVNCASIVTPLICWTAHASHPLPLAPALSCPPLPSPPDMLVLSLYCDYDV